MGDILIRRFLVKDESEIKKVFKNAFAYPPWEMNFSDEFVDNAWDSQKSLSDFKCLVAEIEGQVAGATWWHSFVLKDLSDQKGEALAEFAQKFKFKSIIWTLETVVHRSFQGRGIGRLLKEAQIQEIRENPPILLLTRMLEGNEAIIKINRASGFLPTRILVPSKAMPGQIHQYWYCYFEK